MGDLHELYDLETITEDLRYTANLVITTLEGFVPKYLDNIMTINKVDKGTAWIMLNQKINDLISDTRFKGIVSMVGSDIIIDEPMLEYEALEAYMKQFKEVE